MIAATDAISLDESEVEISFIRASGPGGQNVNKVSTAAQLRFNARASRTLPPEIAIRVERLAGSRASKEGVIVITARRFSSQERNRTDALERLLSLIARAEAAPAKRRLTRPTLASKRLRLEHKARRSDLKAARARPGADD